ncbi:protein mono-ADP-ribosyltransferase PARP15-like [Haliotis cracherodii]|uniref:protein mono-ADP-ribosyltransferase PARP15-like n=1 Tax=Haliotis cracherodii TaxID=6455 RepID=UPI0039E987D8
MKVELVTGSIADQQVDVLVNTTTKDLNLSSGPVTKAILSGAGQSIQQQCRDNCPDGIDFGEICETDGGSLTCKQIYHSSLPAWSDDAEQVLQSFLETCLKEADDCEYNSIAFPAVGTGVLKYPPETVARVFLKTIVDFVSDTINISLTVVRIVIYPSDTAVIEAFKAVKTDFAQELDISSSLDKVQCVPPLKPQPQGQPEASNVVVVVSLLTGDITKQTTDVIINTTNPALRLADGVVSKILLEAAGDDLQDECNTKYPSGVKVGEVAVTGGGNLSCKQVYHITLKDRWSQDQSGTEKLLKATMLKCLKTADDAGLTSLSFPALGTGKLKYDPVRVAQLMYDVCLSFRSRGLSKVMLVVHASSPDVKQAFDNELAKRKKAKSAGSPKSPPSLAMTIGQVSSVKITLVKGSIVDQKVDVVVNSCTPNLNLSSGPLTKAVLAAAGETIQAECKQTYPNGIKPEEVAVTSGGKMSCKQIFHITLNDWKPDDAEVEKAFKNVIHLCLKTACQGIHSSIAIPILGSGVLKYPPQYVTKWVFETIRNFGARNPACSLAEARIVVRPEDSKNIQALESAGAGGARPVSATPSIAENLLCPPEWTPMAHDTYFEVIPVTPGTQEYQDVATHFGQSMRPHTIVSIERVQNRTLYIQYMAMKQRLEVERRGIQNERMLWHGTSEDATININMRGFNRNFCNKNVMYGEGVYFALNSKYSAQDTYSKKDQQGHKRMYQAQVLTGEFTTGTKGMRHPPPKDPSTPHDAFDCLVNNVSNPEIFVIFHDAQAYPAYLVTFTD